MLDFKNRKLTREKFESLLKNCKGDYKEDNYCTICKKPLVRNDRFINNECVHCCGLIEKDIDFKKFIKLSDDEQQAILNSVDAVTRVGINVETEYEEENKFKKHKTEHFFRDTIILIGIATLSILLI